MNSAASIDNDNFKHGETDFDAIRHCLSLTKQGEQDIALQATEMAPSLAKFNSDTLVRHAVSITTSVAAYFNLERGKVISLMNLSTLMMLHRCLHGKKDVDFLAEAHPERLADPLAGPLARRMHDIADVRDVIRERKRIEVEEWQRKFARVANGRSSISLSEALKIVFPRAENHMEYYERHMGPPITGIIKGIRPAMPITVTRFPGFASKLRADYETNKDAWTKDAQRKGGHEGGKKSAAKRAADAEREAVRNLDSMAGRVNDEGKKVLRKKNF